MIVVGLSLIILNVNLDDEYDEVYFEWRKLGFGEERSSKKFFSIVNSFRFLLVFSCF